METVRRMGLDGRDRNDDRHWSQHWLKSFEDESLRSCERSAACIRSLAKLSLVTFSVIEPANRLYYYWIYCSFVKVKVHTLDIAPLRSESPPQKRSGTARVLKGFHSFTCTPTRSSAIGMSHTCLWLPNYNRYSFTSPRRDGGRWCEGAQAEIRTCNLPIANPALYHTTTSAP